MIKNIQLKLKEKVTIRGVQYKVVKIENGRITFRDNNGKIIIVITYAKSRDKQIDSILDD